MEFPLDVFTSICENAKLLNMDITMIYPESNSVMIGFYGNEYDNRESRVGTVRVFDMNSSNMHSIQDLRKHIRIPFAVMTKDLKSAYSKLIPGVSRIMTEIVYYPWCDPYIESFTVYSNPNDYDYIKFGTYRTTDMIEKYNRIFQNPITMYEEITSDSIVQEIQGKSSTEGAFKLSSRFGYIFVNKSFLNLNKGDKVEIGMYNDGYESTVSVRTTKKKGVILNTRSITIK